MMNRVNLVGRLTADPTLRYTPNGVAVATFTLAVTRRFANAENVREADFINCVAWKKTAENVANYLKKGSKVAVDGRLQTRNYEGQDGRKVYVTEVVAEFVDFLDSPNSNNNNGNGNGNTNRNQNNQNRQSQGQRQQQNPNQQSQGQSYKNPWESNTNVDDDPFRDDGLPIDISDDDLPF